MARSKKAVDLYHRHCERRDSSAVAHRAKADGSNPSCRRKNGLLRRFAPLRKRFAFVAGNDGSGHSLYEFFSPLISGPNNSQLSPLNRIIWSCSSGAKSVGLVLILVPGR
jgi:hypothetical protein